MLEENNNFEINNNTQEPFQEVNVSPYNQYKVDTVENKNKRKLRRLGVIIGLPVIFLSLIGYLWSIAYLFLTTKVAGMTMSDAIKFSENPAIQQILQIVLSCIMFLIPFSIAVKCMGLRIDQTVKFGKAKKGTFLPFVLFGIGFCSFSNIAMSYADQIFQGFGIDYDVDFGDNPTGVFGFLLSFIATAIVPALVEEFACRGIVLELLKKYGQGFAIVASSIIFGIMHGNFEQIPFAILVGLILGYIYVKTESIWTGVLVHGVNNAVSVIFTYLQNTMSLNMQNILYMVYLIIGLIAAIIGILLFAKKGDDNYNLEKYDDEITEKEKYIYFFTSWAIIVFVVLNFIEAMSYFVIN